MLLICHFINIYHSEQNLEFVHGACKSGYLIGTNSQNLQASKIFQKVCIDKYTLIIYKSAEVENRAKNFVRLFHVVEKLVFQRRNYNTVSLCGIKTKKLPKNILFVYKNGNLLQLTLHHDKQFEIELFDPEVMVQIICLQKIPQ